MNPVRKIRSLTARHWRRALRGRLLRALRRRSPRTMAGLVAGGCAVVAAPLFAALLLAWVALDRLSEHSEQLVQQGLSVARLGWSLRENLDNLERCARQYIALGDPSLLDLFYSRVRDTEATLRDIESAHLALVSAEGVQEVRAGVEGASASWTAALRNGESLDPAVRRIHALGGVADSMIDAGRAEIDAQVDRLTDASRLARAVILVCWLALAPLAAMLAAMFSLAVRRPLQRLTRGILQLGDAQYRQSIAIAYPEELRALGERLNWLRQRLAQLEADKDRFLRHVSHELKTPLATLYEGTQLFSDGSLGALNPRQQEVAQILADATSELHGQIANLLAFAEWREGQQHGEKDWFEALPLVSEVLAAQRLPMSKRALSWELDVQSPCLFGQRSQLRVALDNLVTNAIKHAPQGTAIHVHARVANRQCELVVRDRGRGVAPDERARIFEPFVRGAEAEETGVRGTGVGLSIVKETAQRHGGNVEIEDAQPGARFRLVWPCPERHA